MQRWLAEQARVRERRGIVRKAVAQEELLGSRTALDLASNDYLGLSTDSRLKSAAVDAAHRYGTGARASRVVTGTQQVHLELERELAVLTGQRAALAFSSGYTANLAALTALGGPGTLIARDEHAHASLIDAARLSRSRVEEFRHSDIGAVSDLLKARRQPRAIVVVESIYSVLGDAAGLRDLARLCAENDATLLVDEAHGIGVAGHGRGGVHAAGLSGADHVIATATLSKALGAQGGAVLGCELLREHLVNTARTFIFDTGLAPPSAAAAAEACRIIAAEPERARAVVSNAALVAVACRTEQAAGAVQSIPVASPRAAAGAAEILLDAGVLVGCFRPPSVPDGVSRLRLTARADLDPDQLRRACAQVGSAIAEAEAMG